MTDFIGIGFVIGFKITKLDEATKEIEIQVIVYMAVDAI